MSHVAQKQDTSDPEVIKRVRVGLVGTERRLTRALSADRGGYPRHQPEGLEQLEGQAAGGPVPRDAGRARRRGAGRALGTEVASGRGALRSCGSKRCRNTRRRRLWDKLDVGYFLRHDAADIAWQTRVLYRHVESRSRSCGRAPRRSARRLQVLVYVQDRPDLFAGICAYFDNNGLSVLDARVTTTRHGYALDNFLVAHPDQDGHYRDIANLVEEQLSTLLTAERILPEPSKGRVSRLVRTFPITPRVDLRADERGQYHILSVSANDRQGLLYSIARVLAQHRIGVAGGTDQHARRTRRGRVPPGREGPFQQPDLKSRSKPNCCARSQPENLCASN